MKKLMCIVFAISFVLSFCFCSYVIWQNNKIETASKQRQEQLEKRIFKQRMDCLESLMQLSKQNSEQLRDLFLKYDLHENADDVMYAYRKLEQFENCKEAIDYDVLTDYMRRDVYCWQKIKISEYVVRNDPKWEDLKNTHEMIMQQYGAYIALIKKI